jgi:hypothetical protein
MEIEIEITKRKIPDRLKIFGIQNRTTVSILPKGTQHAVRDAILPMERNRKT